MAVVVDLTKFRQLAKVTSNRSPTMKKFKQRAAQDYRSFLFKRFNAASRGDGTWPDTLRRALGLSRFILRKTHTLYKALSPVFRGLPGQYEKLEGNTITVAIRGGRHPEFKGTVGRLAEIHHTGEGRNKRRLIFVAPPRALISTWSKRLKAIVKKDAKK